MGVKPSKLLVKRAEGASLAHGRRSAHGEQFPCTLHASQALDVNA